MLFTGSLWIRESPRWLFLHDRRKQAMKDLCWIRQLEASDIYITEEVAAIDQAHEYQKATVGLGFWKPFKALGARPNMMWRLFLGCMLFFWQNGSGINAINYYSPTIFSVRTPLICMVRSGRDQMISSTDILLAEHRCAIQHSEHLNRCLRCGQGHHDVRLVAVPHRSARKAEASSYRWYHRLRLHVGHWCIHLCGGTHETS